MGVWPQAGAFNTAGNRFAVAEAETERKHERAVLGEQVEAAEAIESQVAALQQAFSDIGKTLEEARLEAEQFREEWKTKLIEVESLLLGFTIQRNQSAGGVVRLRGSKAAGIQAPEEPSKGWPSATGDIRLTHNNPPAGWLQIGDERYDVARDDYKELSWVLRDMYGSPVTGAWFRLPAKSDLTNNPAILDNPNIRFIIRT